MDEHLLDFIRATCGSDTSPRAVLRATQAWLYEKNYRNLARIIGQELAWDSDNEETTKKNPRDYL